MAQAAAMPRLNFGSYSNIANVFNGVADGMATKIYKAKQDAFLISYRYFSSAFGEAPAGMDDVVKWYISPDNVTYYWAGREDYWCDCRVLLPKEWYIKIIRASGNDKVALMASSVGGYALEMIS